MSQRAVEQATEARRRGDGPGVRSLLVFAAFAAIALLVYQAALHGPFLSDDFGYIVSNPYTSALTWENLRAILNPLGPARLYTANYAPVHLLLTSLERQIFADDPFGYHVVNVLLLAADSTLLVALLRASGLPALGALVAGAVFLLHPANVEAVAWVSQLKSVASLALALGALGLQPRRPAAAAALFGLGLLTKASAAFAWPMACALAWARCPASGASRREIAWLALWGLLLALFAVPEFASFAGAGAAEMGAFSDLGQQVRTIAAIGVRYLVMAATSFGVAAFQEPAPVASWLDPWCLAAWPAAGVFVWRVAKTLRAREPEAAWWIAAAAAWVPVSQLFPFLNPIADRYLLFILPGLIGGTALALAPALTRAPLRRAALAVAALAALFFAFVSLERTRLWRDETLLLLDAARRYPDGATASYLRARRAAQLGDAPAAVAALREASQRGIDRFMALEQDPSLRPVRDTPEFRVLIRDMAGAWLERGYRRGLGTPAELRVMAHAHVARAEYARAAELLERALAQGSPFDAVLREDLEAVRSKQQSEADASAPALEETFDRPPRP